MAYSLTRKEKLYSIEAIPFKTFKDKIKITKEVDRKGFIEICEKKQDNICN